LRYADVNLRQLLGPRDSVAEVDLHVDHAARDGRQQLHRTAGIGFYYSREGQATLNLLCCDRCDGQLATQRRALGYRDQPPFCDVMWRSLRYHRGWGPALIAC